MKLFSYLDEIQSDETYRLQRYIDSDYFNTNERLKTLFEAIRSVLSHFSKKQKEYNG